MTTIERTGSVSNTGCAVYALSGENPLSSKDLLSPRLLKGSAAATHPASPKYVNQPVSPCSSGEQPVYEVVIADAVVDGKTEVIAVRLRRASSPPAPRRRR